MEKEEMTLDEVKALNKSIDVLCKQYVLSNRVDLIGDVKDMIPAVQKFALWFLAEPEIGVDPEVKEDMNKVVLDILNDITESLKYGDSVLMYDALKCGVAEYLKLFIPEEELEDE